MKFNGQFSDIVRITIVRVSTQILGWDTTYNSQAYENPKYSSIINIDYTDQGLNCGGLSYQVSQGMGMQP